MNTWKAIRCHSCKRNVAYSYIPAEFSSVWCHLCAHSLSDISGAIGGAEGVGNIPGPVSFNIACRDSDDKQDSITLRQRVIGWCARIYSHWPTGITPKPK